MSGIGPSQDTKAKLDELEGVVKMTLIALVTHWIFRRIRSVVELG